MRHYILIPLLGMASVLTSLPAEASDRASRREQAQAAKEELDRKFTPAFARENLVVGTTTRAQVIALYGEHYEESTSSAGSSLLFDKRDIRNRTTTGVRRFANRIGGLTDLASHIPGVNASAGMGAARTATQPIGTAGSAAGTVERLRDNADPYNSTDRLHVSFDSKDKLTDFYLH